MTALLCALTSGAGFYLSTDLGTFWPLAWLAPIPVLWLAFGPARPWTVFFAAWAAGAIGGFNLLPAYAGTLPTPVLALAIIGPGLLFAASVMGARFRGAAAIATGRHGRVRGALDDVSIILLRSGLMAPRCRLPTVRSTCRS